MRIPYRIKINLIDGSTVVLVDKTHAEVRIQDQDPKSDPEPFWMNKEDFLKQIVLSV